MRALDPGAGPIERFACQLRALRAAAAEPAFWKMARRCDVSKSALAAAVAGRQMPSERVTRGFVRACGGDWPSWRQRWMSVVAELAATTADTVGEAELDDARQPGKELVPFLAALPARTGPADAVVPATSPADTVSVGFVWIPTAEPEQSGSRIRTWLIALTLTALITGTAVAAGVRFISERPDSAPSAAPIRILDGTDPTIAGCRADKAVLDSAPVVLERTADLRGRRLTAGTVVGSINLLYSIRCAGAWPWFDPTPGLNPDPNDTTVGVLTVQGNRPTDNTANTWRMGHIESTYGNLLLTGLGCVQASARVDMAGQNVAATGHTRCLPKV